ncbi:MAG: phosphoribosyltransferase family protein [Patescibacteria group bacterium]|nr:phosphoribosyltransferase family protein [Patescibacteria group bacterium]
MLKQIQNFCLDTLFPIECISCSEEGKFLCDHCFEDLELNRKQDCPKCHKETKLGNFCKECKNTSRLNGVIVSASYENDLLQKTIHTLKYKYIEELAKPLGNILISGLRMTLFKDKIDNDYIILPIPLHKKKFRERGFNQAELLGLEVAKYFKLACLNNVIIRIKNTKSQMSLNPIYRRKNIKGAFVCNKPEFIKDKKIILVDDVCTTSSTLEECAKAIYDYGPREIWGLVLARGK